MNYPCKPCGAHRRITEPKESKMTITIDKAIEHLDECMSETEKILYPEVLAAHKLGIEALRYVNGLRHQKHIGEGIRIVAPLLPSETEG